MKVVDKPHQGYIIAESDRQAYEYHVRKVQAGLNGQPKKALCDATLGVDTDLPLEAWDQPGAVLAIRWCKRCNLIMQAELHQAILKAAAPKGGDVVFFTKCRRTLTRKDSIEVGFKGTGYGVMLGIVPPGIEGPPQSIIRRQMGECGYVLFDDVFEFLGELSGTRVTEMFKNKYWGPKLDERSCDVHGVVDCISCGGADKKPELSLVDSSGKPLKEDPE